MSPQVARTVRTTLIATLLCSGALGQVFTCASNAGIPPMIRAEGRSELAGQIVLTCVGDPTASTTSIAISVNTTVTSRIIGSQSEAMLLVDDPNPSNMVPGVNLFFATPSSGVGNGLMFSGIPLRSAKTTPLVFRIANVRVDANALGVTPGPAPTSVVASISASGVNVVGATQTIGYVSKGMIASVLPGSPGNTGSTAFPVCQASNPTLLGPSGRDGAISLKLGFREGFARAFLPRIAAPVQNQPGVVYDSESGIFLTPSPDGANVAGAATNGTRLMARFTNVPVGVQLYVTNVPISQPGPTAGAGLLLTDSTGKGNGFAPPTSTATYMGMPWPIAPVQLTGGTGVAVWEINGASSINLESFEFGLVVAYAANAVAPTDMGVAMGFAPIVNPGIPGGDDWTVTPRFLNNALQQKTVKFYSCDGGGLADLSVESLSVPPVILAGASNPIAAFIRNDGPVAAPIFEVTAEVWLSGVRLSSTRGRVPVGLPPFSIGFYNLSFAVNSIAAPGDAELRFAVDTASEIPESSETNNSFSIPTRVECGTSVVTPLILVGAGGGLTSLPFTSGCAVTIISEVSWITPAAPAVSVAANTTGASRTGIVRINGVPLTITQLAADSACTFTLTTTDPTPVPETGAVKQLTLTASAPTCAWTAASSTRWVQIYPLSGRGSAQLQVTVFPNFGTRFRTANAGAGTQVLPIPQMGASGTRNRRLVQLIYFGFFGRLPAEAEITLQVAELDRGVSAPELIERFMSTPEFNNGGRFVAGLYVGLINRDAEYGGWLFQRNALSTGIVTQNVLVSNFLNSEEWRLKFGTPDNAAFVRLMYRNVLLREPTQAEVDFHVGTLTGGVVTRVQLATNFLNSAEFRTGTGSRLTAFLLYATLLGRDPYQPEFDRVVTALNGGSPLRGQIDLVTALGMPGAEFPSLLE